MRFSLQAALVNCYFYSLFCEDRDVESAVKLFAKLVEANPLSVQAHYALALATHRLAKKRRSNEVVEHVIDILYLALQCPDVADTLYLEMGILRAELLTFLGMNKRSLQ